MEWLVLVVIERRGEKGTLHFAKLLSTSHTWRNRDTNDLTNHAEI